MNDVLRAGLAIVATLTIAGSALAADPWATYKGADGPGAGKKIVLVSGDEEYRSEEALPQLGKILSTHHGFDCTVVFPIHPEHGYIDANYQRNIPGIEALDDADLMVIFTRFRNLPDEQMAAVDRFLKAGKPVVGLRTSTHAFQIGDNEKWEHYSNGYMGREHREWRDGFGRLVLGEKWISHHGQHKHESARGIIAPDAKDHPIARGIADGDIWGSTDVYGVRLPMQDECTPVILGQVVKRDGKFDKDDLHFGMRPTDSEAAGGDKNDPMMPIAWTKTYQLPDGEAGRAFTSTIGASADMTNEGVRRLLVHGVYWALGMEDAIPENGANADIVGEFNPTQFEFRSDDYWRNRNMQVDEHRM